MGGLPLLDVSGEVELTAGLAGQVYRASELAEATEAGGIDRWLPVAAPLRPLLPGGALRRGTTVAVGAGASSLVLALLAPVTSGGGWAAVVGMPALSALAAAQAGAVLERLAWVPRPGLQWTAVVAALLDGFDLVVVAPPRPVDQRLARRLAARARQRGAVLMPYGAWEGVDLTLTAGPGEWSGLGLGRGRLRCRELTITARGRGAAERPRQVRVRLPDPTGRLAEAPENRPTLVPVTEQRTERPVRRGAPITDRPTLRVLPGRVSCP